MLTKEYTATLNLIKKEIYSARIQVVRAVIHKHIDLYFKIGKIILEKQKELKWGKSVVDQISKDLQTEYPGSTGFSARNLWDMRRFYARYAANEFLQQLVAQIPWGHNVRIISKIEKQ